MLTASELSDMRAEVARAMPSVAAITRRGASRNAMGGRDASPAAVSGLGAVPCHVYPDASPTSSETEQRGRVAGSQQVRIAFAHGVDVRATDVATISGVAYEIVAVDAGRSWALELTADAVRAV